MEHQVFDPQDQHNSEMAMTVPRRVIEIPPNQLGLFRFPAVITGFPKEGIISCLTYSNKEALVFGVPEVILTPGDHVELGIESSIETGEFMLNLLFAIKLDPAPEDTQAICRMINFVNDERFSSFFQSN